MKFNYKMSRSDLKKMYMKDYQKFNIIYLVLATIIFLIMNKDVIKYNYLLFVLLYVILIVLLGGILYGFDLIYSELLLKINDKNSNGYGDFVVTFDKQGISSENNESKIVIKWNDIKKIIYKKTRIYIKYDNENKLVLLINKDFLKRKKDFEKIKNYLVKKAKI